MKTVILNVKVITNAKASKIDSIEKVDQQYHIKLRVKEVPEDGKANRAIIELLASHMKIAKSCISFISGLTSKIKRLQAVTDKDFPPLKNSQNNLNL
ncbi:MAG: DUF167 domain-containing protein [Rickettsiales bacterium]